MVMATGLSNSLPIVETPTATANHAKIKHRLLILLSLPSTVVGTDWASQPYARPHYTSSGVAYKDLMMTLISIWSIGSSMRTSSLTTAFLQLLDDFLNHVACPPNLVEMTESTALVVLSNQLVLLVVSKPDARTHRRPIGTTKREDVGQIRRYLLGLDDFFSCHDTLPF